jgi:hypothetical protein
VLRADDLKNVMAVVTRGGFLEEEMSKLQTDAVPFIKGLSSFLKNVKVF